MSTKKLQVKVPEKEAEEIEKYVEEHRYLSTSEFLRDAIRRILHPPLLEQVLEDIEEGRKEFREGKTHSHEEVKKRLGVS